MDNGRETLLSILCSELWRWDSEDWNRIQFNENNTGEVRVIRIASHLSKSRAEQLANALSQLTCKYENNVFIAADLTWKAVDSTNLEQVIPIPINNTNTNTNASINQSPSPLTSPFTLEITLQKRRIPSLQDARFDKHKLNEKILTDAAFEPKTYTLRLEQGRFRTPHELLNDGKNCPDWVPWYALRLVFDTSPYPPRKEWKYADEQPVPDVYKFWEWKEFCTRELPKQAEEKETGVWRWIRRTLGL
jgi:hypothetical protein